jgi:hypothetical protein
MVKQISDWRDEFPCPRCGGKTSFFYTGSVCVVCLECRFKGPFEDTKKQAIRKWVDLPLPYRKKAEESQDDQ